MAVYVCGLYVCGLLAVSVWWNDGCLCVWSLCVWSASCGSVVE